MKRQTFNDNWIFWKEGSTKKQTVTLPHDAMIHEERRPDVPGGGAHGYFPGGKYVYEKRFTAPDEWREKTVSIEFEGVYRNSKVFINGREAGGRPYGYVPFVICMDAFLVYGGENVITVTVDNSELPNSRWYTGSGIYRPVSLLISPKEHIAYQGVRITTLSFAPARIRVETDASASDEVKILVEILEQGRVIASGSGRNAELAIPDAKLWSDETPYLYECRVSLKKQDKVCDTVTEKFGIRLITWSSGGLLVNGKQTLLRGGCIHHDNGILGAACWTKSEERRVRIMKEHGFNALRSAHNPASKAMLEACDRYGMYLMDETFDMWYVRKSKYDYGRDFKEWWQADTKAMIDRDYNHPSVIMYSIGNEVSEPGKPEGVKLGKEMISFVKSLDASRAVTGGMNLMIIGNYAKGKGQYDNVDKEEKKKAANDSKEPKNASLIFNMMATVVGPGMNKAGNSKKVDMVTTPILDALDIAGYNYASGRYPLEGKLHPGRVIVGSETFPYEIYKNWEQVKKYPYLVGDFMWTAWDYLGEAGLGAWSYTGGMPFNRPYPWLLGGTGVIDILGNPDASCRYAETVWERADKPVIAVRPVNHPGVRVSKSVWRGTNAIESWSWRGCDGNKAQVEIYAGAAGVELFLNGKSLGKKRLKECKAVYKTRYAEGTLRAVAYDADGAVLGESTLSSAKGKFRITLKPEEAVIQAGDIVYVPVEITGENGIVESNADEKLSVSVEGGTLLAFGSADPCTQERYDAGSFTAYQGRALAVVYAPQPGKIKISVSGEKLGTESVAVTAV